MADGESDLCNSKSLLYTTLMTKMRALSIAVSSCIFFPGALTAQTNVCANQTGLACLIPNLYAPATAQGGLKGQSGLTLPVVGHNAHFTTSGEGTAETLPLIGPLNSAIGNELALIPVASPASGLMLTFDPALGVTTQAQQNLGAIISERGETLGKGRVFVGFTYQYFNFTSLDGQDLRKLPVVFKHAQGQLASTNPAIHDVITTVNDFGFHLNQVTAFVTVGLTNRLDVTAAIPIVSTHLSATSDATLQRYAPSQSPPTHYFDVNNQVGSTRSTFGFGSNATGLGDVTLRAKGTLIRGEALSVAFGTDFRLPSGDEMNLLGTGALGVRPFFAVSGGRGRFSPHMDVGYQFNGKSILAGNTVTGQKSRLPGQWIYSAGTEIGLARYVSLSLDYLGQAVVHGQRLIRTQYTPTAPADGNGFATQFDTSDILPTRETFFIHNGSIGVKLQPANKFFLTANLIFKLNDAGLRSTVVPLIGLGYAF